MEHVDPNALFEVVDNLRKMPPENVESGKAGKDSETEKKKCGNGKKEEDAMAEFLIWVFVAAFPDFPLSTLFFVCPKMITP